MPGKYWEPKLSELLRNEKLFPYSHKCPDAPHGGQAKIDFLVLNNGGRFYGIEVKWVQTKQKIFHVKEVTPLQGKVLDDIDTAANSIVAVGYNKEALYLFDWSTLRHETSVHLDDAFGVLSFNRGDRPTSEDLWSLLRELPQSVPMKMNV